MPCENTDGHRAEALQIIRVRPVSPVHSSFTLFLLPFPSWMSDANFGSHRRSPRATDNARSGPSGAGYSTQTPSILVPHQYTRRFKPLSIPETSETYADTPPSIYRDHLKRCMPQSGYVMPRTGIPSNIFRPHPIVVSDPHSNQLRSLPERAPPGKAPGATRPYRVHTANIRLPIEICERVIDAVYVHDTHNHNHSVAIHTLENCALVCRDWTFRAQSWIFHTVKLEDIATLHRFATLLTGAPAICRHVRRLYVVGWLLHSPTSVITHLPFVLRGRLPQLHSIVVFRSLDEPQGLQGNNRSLPHLPIHPHFPLSFRHIGASLTNLHLEGLTFPSFTDFARALQSASEVVELVCVRVRWSPPSIPPLPLEPGTAKQISLHRLKKLIVSLW